MPPLGEKPLSGQKKITTTNTAEQVRTTSTSIISAVVKAAKTNVAVVYIGPSTITATGYSIEPNEGLEFDVVDLSRVYIYGKENDVVEFFGLEP